MRRDALWLLFSRNVATRFGAFHEDTEKTAWYLSGFPRSRRTRGPDWSSRKRNAPLTARPNVASENPERGVLGNEEDDAEENGRDP